MCEQHSISHDGKYICNSHLGRLRHVLSACQIDCKYLLFECHIIWCTQWIFSVVVLATPKDCVLTQLSSFVLYLQQADGWICNFFFFLDFVCHNTINRVFYMVANLFCWQQCGVLWFVWVLATVTWLGAFDLLGGILQSSIGYCNSKRLGIKYVCNLHIGRRINL